MLMNVEKCLRMLSTLRNAEESLGMFTNLSESLGMLRKTLGNAKECLGIAIVIRVTLGYVLVTSESECTESLFYLYSQNPCHINVSVLLTQDSLGSCMLCFICAIRCNVIYI